MSCCEKLYKVLKSKVLRYCMRICVLGKCLGAIDVAVAVVVVCRCMGEKIS